MNTILLLVALTCPKTEMVGFSDQLTKEDVRAQNRAEFVCSFRYPKSPCLVRFEKKKEHAYAALCGARR